MEVFGNFNSSKKKFIYTINLKHTKINGQSFDEISLKNKK
jgi:hypothetical protein